MKYYIWYDGKIITTGVDAMDSYPWLAARVDGTNRGMISIFNRHILTDRYHYGDTEHFIEFLRALFQDWEEP